VWNERGETELGVDAEIKGVLIDGSEREEKGQKEEEEERQRREFK
jgi:hypothetical protein